MFATGSFVRFPVGFLAVAGTVGGRVAFGAAFEGDGWGAGATGCARAGHDGFVSFLVEMAGGRLKWWVGMTGYNLFTDGGVLAISVKHLVREERETESEFVFVWWTKSEGLSGAGPACLVPAPTSLLLVCLLAPPSL